MPLAEITVAVATKTATKSIIFAPMIVQKTLKNATEEYQVQSTRKSLATPRAIKHAKRIAIATTTRLDRIINSSFGSATWDSRICLAVWLTK